MNSKALLKSFLAVAVIGLLAACGGTETADSADKTAPNIEKVVKEVAVASADDLALTADIGIGGMTCSMGCAKSIEQNIAAMEGVASCSVDFENQIAHVTYDHESVSEDDMVKFINEFRDGTYSVTSLEITKPVLKDAPASDSVEEGNESEDEGVSVAQGFTFPNIFDVVINMALR